MCIILYQWLTLHRSDAMQHFQFTLPLFVINYLYECILTAPLKGTRSMNNPNSYIVLFKENLSKELGKHFILLSRQISYSNS